MMSKEKEIEKPSNCWMLDGFLLIIFRDFTVYPAEKQAEKIVCLFQDLWPGKDEDPSAKEGFIFIFFQLL